MALKTSGDGMEIGMTAAGMRLGWEQTLKMLRR